MSNEMIEYILGLKEKDAVRILLNAKEESNRCSMRLKDTEAFGTYAHCVEVMRQMIIDDLLHPNVDQLRFIYAVNKLKWNQVI